MILKFNKEKIGGFTLLELTIVLIIATILTSAIIPQLINGYTIKEANKTALDISAIEEASTAYYIKNSTWPGVVSGDAVSDLTSGNYLPSSWQAINPFGFSSATPSNFSYNFELSGPTQGASLWIYTYVPNSNAQTLIKNLLPASWVDTTKNIVYASVSVPGILPNIVPTGAILAWTGTTAPVGFLICDGTVYPNNAYPNLSPVLGSTFGGDGTNTFAVPDLRGRMMLGLNTLTANDGTSRVWSMDTYSNNLGQPASYNVAQIGGISGEEKHRQTLVEMAPHTHSFSGWDYIKGFSGNSTSSPRDPQTGTTGSAGGNGDGTGLGAAANVVPPSVTMNFIIKT